MNPSSSWVPGKLSELQWTVKMVSGVGDCAEAVERIHDGPGHVSATATSASRTTVRGGISKRESSSQLHLAR
jgi:hypothetical protein